MNRLRVGLWVLLLAVGRLAAAGEPPSAASSGFFYQEASWSPDGSTLLLSRFDGDRYRIYRLARDGSGLTRLTDGPDYWTSFSPDGSRFAFKSERDGNGEIYVANKDGSVPVAISRHPAEETTPAWSPDGALIAFVSDRDGPYQLYTMSVDGSNQTRLSHSEGEEYNPCWSADGEHLAYFVSEHGEDWIHVIRRDGSAKRKIARGIFPSWSPDSHRILYDRQDQIFSATPEGESERLLVDGGFAGRWSPDGEMVAFVRGSWPSSEVYLLEVESGRQIHLTRAESYSEGLDVDQDE